MFGLKKMRAVLKNKGGRVGKGTPTILFLTGTVFPHCRAMSDHSSSTSRSDEIVKHCFSRRSVFTLFETVDSASNF